jgi:hypothetical protein
MAGYGSSAGSLSMVSTYVSFTPIYTNTPREITTLKIEVVTAATSTGSPLIQFAMYNCKNNTLSPSTQISGTYTAGINPTTTGVKTTTFSPTWVLPKGLSFFGMNIKCTADNNTCYVRGLDGSGRENTLLGSIGSGFDGTNPNNTYASAALPYFYSGNNVTLLSDYSSSSMYYSDVGASRTETSYVSVFLK